MNERILGMIVLSLQIALYLTWMVSMKAEKDKYSVGVYIIGFIAIALIAFGNIALATWAIGMIVG